MKQKLLYVLLFIILVTFTSGAYLLGSSHASSSGSFDQSYSRSIVTLRQERDQAVSDYDSACANYRTLYTAYDALYQKTGSTSGLTRLAPVDGARGNEESCYRD